MFSNMINQIFYVMQYTPIIMQPIRVSVYFGVVLLDLDREN